LRAHNDVDSGQWADSAHYLENSKAAKLAQASLEAVTLHRRVAVLWNDETDS
jgi:hypothetical protein